MSGLPKPRSNPYLFGHEAAEAQLAEAIRTHRLHHAWLISGMDGIGKATLAYRFARRLLAGPVPGSDTLAMAETEPAFRRVAAGTHADLLTIERQWDEKRKKLRGEIVVGDIREVSEFLHRTPAEGGWRAVVVDGAEDLNRNAANALLKMLEEPPRRAILLLVCSATGRLLPTIRSRCRQLRLQSLNDAAIAAVLERALPDMPAGERDRLAALAGGSPGHAIRLADGGAAIADMVDAALGRLPDLSAEHAYATADTLGRTEEAFSTFMDLLRASVASAVREAARGRADAAQARMLDGRPLDAWVDVWHALTRIQRETEDLYLDKRQALVSGFSLLARRA